MKSAKVHIVASDWRLREGGEYRAVCDQIVKNAHLEIPPDVADLSGGTWEDVRQNAGCWQCQKAPDPKKPRLYFAVSGQEAKESEG